VFNCSKEDSVPALKPGDKAPPIRLETDAGKPFDLAALKGSTVVLFFYPKASTSG
jgi:peroxiredoxin